MTKNKEKLVKVEAVCTSMTRRVPGHERRQFLF